MGESALDDEPMAVEVVEDEAVVEHALLVDELGHAGAGREPVVVEDHHAPGASRGQTQSNTSLADS